MWWMKNKRRLYKIEIVANEDNSMLRMKNWRWLKSKIVLDKVNSNPRLKGMKVAKSKKVRFYWMKLATI